MNIWVMIFVNMVIGLIAIVTEFIYCGEKKGGKNNVKYRAASYESYSKCGEWWRSIFGKFFGNVIGIIMVINAWFIWIPIHRILIKKILKEHDEEES